MASPTISDQSRALTKPLLDGAIFDLIYGLTIAWFLTGEILDSWAHENVPRLETFWTPWHAVLYTGILASLLVLISVMLLNRVRGAANWREAIPAGYGPAVLGAFGMILASGGDAAWHTFFGVEKNVDALFSPTHILIIMFTSLMSLGPLRAMYRRGETGSFGEHIRLACALLWFYALLMIAAQGTHYFVIFKLPLTAHTGQDNEQILASASFVLQTVILVGCILAVLQRWELRFFGFFTFVLTIVGTALSQIHGFQIGIPISLMAGLAIDTAYVLIRPKLTNPLSLRLFAAVAGAALPVFYLVALRVADGPLAWSIHMLFGLPLVCALCGWLLTYLTVPSQG